MHAVQFMSTASLVKRTIEILPSGVGDFPILYSLRCYIIYVSCMKNVYPFRVKAACNTNRLLGVFIVCPSQDNIFRPSLLHSLTPVVIQTFIFINCIYCFKTWSNHAYAYNLTSAAQYLRYMHDKNNVVGQSCLK
jgi:hypothetical protein